MNIQKDVIKYVDMISTVFNVIVDCADTEKIQVAGTGRFRRNVGKPLHSGKVFSKVMETGERLLVKKASEDAICKGCINLQVCKNMCELCVPIKLEKEVIGAICMASENDEQYHIIMDNLEKLTLFMEEVANFIATKAKEYQSRRVWQYQMDVQDKLINMIRAGVMILDESDMIVYMNQYCENVLGCALKSLPYLKRIKNFSIRQMKHNENGEAEYYIRIYDKRLYLNGQATCISGIKENEINTVFTFNQLKGEALDINEDIDLQAYTFSKVIGADKVFLEMLYQCKQSALSNKPVLLSGESGTQKGMLAKVIHNESAHYSGSFIEIDQHNMNEKLLGNGAFRQDEVMGDIIKDNTVYFCNIDEFGFSSQRIILEIIKTAELYNAKIICSTEKDLKQSLKKGEVYPELFLYLEPYRIRVPALRTRGKDIGLLAEHYLEKYNQKFHRGLVLAKDFQRLLAGYTWIGNIRELKNVMAYIVEQAPEDVTEISAETVPELILRKLENDTTGTYNLAMAERRLIMEALREFGFYSRSKKRVAKELGISSATLYRKLKEYGITEEKEYRIAGEKSAE